MENKTSVCIIKIFEYNKYRKCKKRASYEIECNDGAKTLRDLYNTVLEGKRSGYIQFNGLFIIPVENFAKAIILKK